MGLFDWIRLNPDPERDERRQELRHCQREEGGPPIYCTIMAGDLADAGPGSERACQLFPNLGVLVYATGNLKGLEKGDCDFLDFANEVRSIDQVTAPASNEGAAFGLGVAGLALAGPIGAVAGALLGGSVKDVLLSVTLRDGRKVLVQALASDLGAIQAVVFRGGGSRGSRLAPPPRRRKPRP